ncbi:MAG: hypothetical protein AAGK32_06955, partial [Actinomycetota bacterium]
LVSRTRPSRTQPRAWPASIWYQLPVFAQPTGQNPLGRVPGGDYRATATTGNWYQIEAGQARGWVREGRVRDTKGDCD